MKLKTTDDEGSRSVYICAACCVAPDRMYAAVEGSVKPLESGQGKTKLDIRKKNRGMVLQLIATGECNTRAGLAARMGLSRMALTNIVSELMGDGILEEAEIVRKNEAGRSPVCLEIAPTAPLLAGLLIERSYIEVVLCDLTMKIHRRKVYWIGGNFNTELLINTCFHLLDDILNGAPEVAAIGVAAIGPVSSTSGRLLKPFYFYGIQNVEIAAILQEKYHLPVFMDHDNQGAAMVEYMYGGWGIVRDILLLGVNEGVGSGIVTDGQRYHNNQGLPPEMGHVSIDLNGTPCECGNRGCIETYIRTPVMLKQLREVTGKHYAYETFTRMEDDPAVAQIFRTAVNQLAAAIVSTLNVINSELILLAGDAAFWNENDIAMLEEIVNETRFVKDNVRVKVRKARFGNDAALLGAACLAAEQIFKGEILFDK